MVTAQSSASYWQFFPLDGYYYLRNEEATSQYQLDITYLNEVPMPSLQPADISSPSQKWIVSANGDFYSITNSALSSNLLLDTYSNTLQAFFEQGGHSGQLWSVESAADINNAAYSTLATVSILYLFYFCFVLLRISIWMGFVHLHVQLVSPVSFIEIQ
jgi:hypothetical protein